MDPRTWRRRYRRAALAIGIITMLGHGGSAAAQSLDARRLDDLKAAVQTEIRHLEAEAFDGQAPLVADLEELRDDVAYLRVAMRRGAAVQAREFQVVEARLQTLRAAIRDADARAREHVLVAPPPEIPVGAELDLRLPAHFAPASDDGEVPFDAVTLADLSDGRRIVVPAGSVVRGAFRRVAREARTDRRASLVVALRELTIGERTYAVDLRLAQVAAAGDTLTVESGEDASVLVGDDVVTLTPGSVIRVRFEAPLELTTDAP